jgi:hypothetical protein
MTPEPKWVPVIYFGRANKYLILNNHGICELEVGTDDIFSRSDKYLLCV